MDAWWPGRMRHAPRNAIILGELNQSKCRALADETLDLDYPGVVGNDPVVLCFVERAIEHGVRFAEPIPQQIYALRGIGEAGPDSVAQSAAGPCRREPEPVNRS